MLAYAYDEESENNNKKRVAFGGNYITWKSSYTWDKGERLAPKVEDSESVIDDPIDVGSRMVLY